MKENFDLRKTGRRMPYTIPDGFFDEMEDNIWKEVANKPAVSVRRKFPYMRVAIRTVTVIAAAIALLIAFNTYSIRNHEGGISSVELAFSELNNEDQTYLLEVYQDDIFINE